MIDESRAYPKNEAQPLLIDRLATPVGDMHLVADREGNLCLAYFAEQQETVRRALGRHYGANGFTLEAAPDPHGLTEALSNYFAGQLDAIDALPVRPAGTQFQLEVWRALRQIPCGTTTSYGELAERIGRPTAARAVGLANGANPVAVVVPCHRVIGANGSLTGYGGGIERKRWLLDHEKGQHLF